MGFMDLPLSFNSKTEFSEQQETDLMCALQELADKLMAETDVKNAEKILKARTD